MTISEPDLERPKPNNEPEDGGGDALARCETLIDASGVPTLKLTGELDIESVGAIRLAFDAIAAKKPARMVIDLSELQFLDSSGLSLFLMLAERVGEIELRNPSAMIRRVISLTGLSSVFVMTP